MSDLMLLGILRMPDASIASDWASLMQFVNAARGAADRIESDAKIIEQLRAELEAAAADRRDADRFRYMNSKFWISQFEIEQADDALAQRQGEGS
ncbi:TPA: hypothetical protein QDA93_002393 [Burkholderia vietnamiensis]|nr:hypothetical protein [Burkholderia vietnamiensis]